MILVIKFQTETVDILNSGIQDTSIANAIDDKVL